MTFIEYLNKFKLIATSITLVITFIIGTYTVYLDIYKSRALEINLIKKEYRESIYQLELTQKSILKSQIMQLELNPCKTSRESWAQYNILFSQHFTLSKKHNPLLKELDSKPMERLKKNSCRCYKGGNCND